MKLLFLWLLIAPALRYLARSGWYLYNDDIETKKDYAAKLPPKKPNRQLMQPAA
jgi:hypothetical protein